MNALLVLWAIRELDLSSATVGLLFSIGSVGALLGALVTGAFARRVGVGRAMWTSAVLSNIGVLLVPLAGGGATAAIATLSTAFFIQGLGATATNVHTYAIRQAVTPDHLMGRTTAVYRALTHGFVPLGALLGGFLGDTLGLRPALAIAALALFPSWLWLYFPPPDPSNSSRFNHSPNPGSRPTQPEAEPPRSSVVRYAEPERASDLFGVGVHRLTEAPQRLISGGRIFSFVA